MHPPAAKNYNRPLKLESSPKKNLLFLREICLVHTSRECARQTSQVFDPSKGTIIRFSGTQGLKLGPVLPKIVKEETIIRKERKAMGREMKIWG